MRTTLDIDADVLEIAKRLAEGRKISVGKALSELARRGSHIPVVERNGFYEFDVGPDVRPFGLEEVQAALEAEAMEYARFFKKEK
jgi:hypothetical protein